ncbi:hypothetical protein [Kordiimonas aquimaris]|uniref:hypothetical protein n=1 Tax=Kordiimonas aquimaris TaxID=707591 RepID=UPI0021D331F7|nr:hypothetical protein [Kordiimonas aquimaris]
MYIEEQTNRKVFGSDSTLGLFVALYLILLAFFIILTSVSQQSVDKASAAMDSVNTVFNESRGDIEPDSYLSDLALASADPVLVAIQSSFVSEFDIPGEFDVSDGYIYQVQLPVTYLYEPGSYLVRASIHPVIDQILQSLKDAPYGSRQQMVLLFGKGLGTTDRELTRTQQIAVRRAGSFARYVEERSLRDFASGFAQIAEDEVMIIFRHQPSGYSVDPIFAGRN